MILESGQALRVVPKMLLQSTRASPLTREGTELVCLNVIMAVAMSTEMLSISEPYHQAAKLMVK